MSAIEPANANQVSHFTKPQAEEALREVVSFYQEERTVNPEVVLEHATVVGQGALAALGATERFLYISDVSHAEAFPFEKSLATSLRPYIIGVTEGTHNRAVYLDHVYRNSHRTVGIVSIPKTLVATYRPVPQNLMANFRGERYDPLADPRQFGRMMATGAQWVLQALR